MAAQIPITCPVDDCDYSSVFRIDIGAPQDGPHPKDILADEHPNHPGCPHVEAGS